MESKKMLQIGRGFHGIVFKLEGFYRWLKSHKITKIEFNKTTTITNEEDINLFIFSLKSYKDIAVKIFTNNSTGTREYINELSQNRKILKFYTNGNKKFITLKTNIEFLKKQIIGCKFFYDDNENSKSVIFSRRCNIPLKRFTSTKFKQFVSDILKSLVVLQSNGHQHVDIKLDNIVFCEDMYKIIDWGKLRSVNDKKIMPHYGIRHNPIILYALGFPLSKSLFFFNQQMTQKFERRRNTNDLHVSHPMFQNAIKTVYNEMYDVLNQENDRTRIFNRFKYSADIYMLGIMLLQILIANKTLHPYQPFVSKCLSIKDPLKNAEDALIFFNKNVK
jgi:serine/threonine protein kinase